jgi:hypothetical protein
MKIWCVDHALTWSIHSDVYFTKEEAQERYDHYSSIKDAYVKMYQVEDIWGWCGRHFNEVILEVLRSRDDGDDAIYIFGLVNELREAAEHCKLEHFRIEGFWVNRYEFALNIAWFHEGQLHMDTRHFDGNDKFYEYPTIVERRSKWQKEN